MDNDQLHVRKIQADERGPHGMLGNTQRTPSRMREPLDYNTTAERKPSPLLWPVWVSLPLTILPSMTLQCVCGHLDLAAFPFLVGGFATAGYAFLRDRSGWLVQRVFSGGATVIAGVVLAKNVADILWFGHAPWL